MVPTELQFAVLRRQSEIDSAAQALRETGFAPEPPASRRAIDAVRRLARRPGAAPGLRSDPVKSWDALRTISAIQKSVARGDPVLDMGSVGSAILPALHAAGYTRLHGIDLNPQVTDMPFADRIEYVVGDMTATPWPDAHFAAITSISVIEHGVPQEALVAEVARLLRPGGAFIFSTDYWPEKIDTSGIELFGAPWTIYSAEELEELIAAARPHGLEPAGDPTPAIRDVDERPINFEGRDYTFVYGALIRSDAPASG